VIILETSFLVALGARLTLAKFASRVMVQDLVNLNFEAKTVLFEGVYLRLLSSVRTILSHPQRCFWVSQTFIFWGFIWSKSSTSI